jgi:hypothetical protein
MEPTVPIATDNIYKFYALFGLVMLIFSGVALVYAYTQHYEAAYKDWIALETLKAKPESMLSTEETVRKRILESKIEIDRGNKTTYTIISSCIGAIGLLLMWSGFYHWQTKVQPKQDQLLDLQLEKLRREIGALDTSILQRSTEPKESGDGRREEPS